MGNARVLVLDDDEDNRLVLEAALQGAGFEVVSGRSCAEGRALLKAWPADAVVTDYWLDDGTAGEWLQSLGARRPRVAILVTGFGRPEDRASSKAAGFDAHLVKPIALDQLVLVLRRTLADRSNEVLQGKNV